MLIVFSRNQKEQWDQIVKSFAHYDVYYLNGYAQPFFDHGDGEPLLLYYESDSIRGMNVVMKSRITALIP